MRRLWSQNYLETTTEFLYTILKNTISRAIKSGDRGMEKIIAVRVLLITFHNISFIDVWCGVLNKWDVLLLVFFNNTQHSSINAPK